MSVRVEFRWSEEFKARVDAAASFESRASFVRRAVEAAVEREESSLARIEMMRSREKPNTVAGVSDALKGITLPEGPPLLAEAVERALATEPRGSEDARVSYAEPPAPAEQPDALERVDEILSGAAVSGIGRRVSPSGPASPRVPFRRDVKPFQRGDK